MNNFSKSLSFLALTLSLSTQAGGLWLNENADPAMGKAGAGSQAGVNDASTVVRNPATMGRLDGSQYLLGAMAIYSQAEFEIESAGSLNGDKNPDDAGGLAPAASFYYTHKIDDKWSWGISSGALAGSALDYGKDWGGSYQATSVELVAVAIAPAVSYKVNDVLSLGASLQFVHGQLELKVSPPLRDTTSSIDGDDQILAYQLGMALKLSEKTELGLTYQSEWDFTFEGDINTPTNEVSVESELPLAQNVRLAINHTLNSDFSIHATLGWDDWSVLDKVNLSTVDNGASITTNWEDTYHYAFGIEYNGIKSWKISSGISYDTSPVSKTDRNAQLPVDRTMKYAVGLQKDYDKDFSYGVQFVYADLGSGDIDSVTGDRIALKGEYTEYNAMFLAFNALWRY